MLTYLYSSETEYWQLLCGVRHDGLEPVVDNLAGTEFVTGIENGGSEFRGVREGGGQTADLVTGQDDVLAVDTLEDGPGLVSHADHLGVVRGLVEVGPDLTDDAGVASTAQT